MPRDDGGVSTAAERQERRAAGGTAGRDDARSSRPAFHQEGERFGQCEKCAQRILPLRLMQQARSSTNADRPGFAGQTFCSIFTVSCPGVQCASPSRRANAGVASPALTTATATANLHLDPLVLTIDLPGCTVAYHARHNAARRYKSHAARWRRARAHLACAGTTTGRTSMRCACDGDAAGRTAAARARAHHVAADVAGARRARDVRVQTCTRTFSLTSGRADAIAPVRWTCGLGRLARLDLVQRARVEARYEDLEETQGATHIARLHAAAQAWEPDVGPCGRACRLDGPDAIVVRVRDLLLVATSSSCSFSPGRRPVNTISMSSSGSKPESRIIWRARSTMRTGSPISRMKISPPAPMVAAWRISCDRLGNRHEVARDVGVGDRDRAAARDLLAEERYDAAVRSEHVAEAHGDEAAAAVLKALHHHLGDALGDAHHAGRPHGLVGRDQHELARRRGRSPPARRCACRGRCCAPPRPRSAPPAARACRRRRGTRAPDVCAVNTAASWSSSRTSPRTGHELAPPGSAARSSISSANMPFSWRS